MHFNLKNHTILATVSGSRSYGMDTETSDLDIKGICISPPEVTLGFAYNFEQAESVQDFEFLKDYIPSELDHLYKNGYEGVIYDLRKFFTLARKGNPNILEVLFCDDEDILLLHPLGFRLRENRELFLSQVVRYTYAGYAFSQLKRIKNHAEWGSKEVSKPRRCDYGLGDNPAVNRTVREKIESAVAKYQDQGYEREQALHILAFHPDWQTEETPLQDKDFVAKVNAEYAYQKAMKEYSDYEAWLRNRNEVRRALEEKHGYDTKHGAHLVRLLRTGRELLETGKLQVKRPDAKELLEIRKGSWSLEKMISWAEQEMTYLQDKNIPTVLPHSPDSAALNKLCVELHIDFYRDS